MPITKEKLSEIFLLFSKVLAWAHIVLGALGVGVGIPWLIEKNRHGQFLGYFHIPVLVCLILCALGIGALRSLLFRKLNFIFGIILFAFSLFANSDFSYFSLIFPVVVLVFTVVVLIRYFRSDKLLAVWVTIPASMFIITSFLIVIGPEVQTSRQIERLLVKRGKEEVQLWQSGQYETKWQSCDTVSDCEMEYHGIRPDALVNKKYHAEFRRAEDLSDRSVYHIDFGKPEYRIYQTQRVKMDKLLRKSLGGLMACEENRCVDKLEDSSELLMKLYKSSEDKDLKEYILSVLPPNAARELLKDLPQP